MSARQIFCCVWLLLTAANFIAIEAPRALHIQVVEVPSWTVVERPSGVFTITASSMTALEEALKGLCQDDRRFICLTPPVRGGNVLVVERRIR